MYAVDEEERGFATGLEVAILVEDAVVGQVVLVVFPVELSLGNDGRRVIDIVITINEADDGSQPRERAAGLDEFLQGAQIGIYKARLEQQIFGRIACQGQLGEANDMRSGCGCLLHGSQDFLGVILKVANSHVYLCKRDTKR